MYILKKNLKVVSVNKQKPKIYTVIVQFSVLKSN